MPVQGAVLVTTPQEVAMADVRKAINMFEQVHIPVLGIVENISHSICSIAQSDMKYSALVAEPVSETL